jgi:serine/threonine protein phosphatase PrpC
MGEARRIQIEVESEHLTATGVSDIGLFRSENQDTIYLDKRGSFVLLADGMGGHEKGAEASQTIIDILQDFFQPETVASELKEVTAAEGIPVEVNGLFTLIDKGIRRSNKLVFEKNRNDGIERYMGSTLVGLMMADDLYVTWFNVGDSRLYRFRDAALSLLTEDHSAYAEWLNQDRIGIEPAKNIVTRAIGTKEDVIPDIGWEKGKKEDIYILCSDGLSDMVDDNVISNIIGGTDSVDRIAVNLLNAALDAGGPDNISIIVCKLI